MRRPLQACLPGAQRLLQACRAAGVTIVHTLEAHQPDLSDLPPSKLARGCLPAGCRIGDEGAMGRILVAGEPGTRACIHDGLARLHGRLSYLHA